MNGHRLAGNGGGVQAALAGENHAVQGDTVAGQDAQHIAHLSLPGRNHGTLFQGDHFRPQVHGFHDLAAAPGHGLFFKIFADAVEQHDADGFREAAHGEGTQGGNAHQEVFIQHVALEQVAAGGFQHRQAQHQVSGHEGNIGGDGQIQPFQEQAHHEETRAGEDSDEVRILFLLLGGGLGLGFQGGDLRLRLFVPGHGQNGGNQGVRVLRRQAQLLCGEGDGGVLYAGDVVDVPLDFGGAVGAVDAGDFIDLLHALAGGGVVMMPVVRVLILAAAVVMPVRVIIVMVMVVMMVFMLLLILAAAVAVMVVMLVFFMAVGGRGALRPGG